LSGRYHCALLSGQCGERFLELRVAVVLAGVSGGQQLFGGGELGGELGAVALVGSPGEIEGDG
jgi:hypothetical protein